MKATNPSVATSAVVRLLAIAIGSTALLVCLAAPVAAQRSVKVVDSFGRPAAAVRIEVYGTGELLGVRATAADGTAVLDVERWAEVRRISLSHLGLATRVVQVGDLPADGVVQLEPEAVAIDGVAVVGRELCPLEPTVEARERWQAASSLYSGETEGRALSARFLRGGERIPDTELYREHQSEMTDFLVAWGGGVWTGDDHDAKPLSERVVVEGYAWEPIDIGGIRDPGAWTYADLHHSAASHFANAAFGDLHDFAIDSESDGVTTLIFCPRSGGDRTTVRGAIRVSEEGGFLNADWRFTTPDRDEGAGGSVDFYPHFEAGDRLPHLMASKGTSFRHSGVEPPHPNLPRSYGRQSIDTAFWKVYPTWDHPCRERKDLRGSGGVPGGGRFRVYMYSDVAATQMESAFRACVDASFGTTPVGGEPGFRP